MSTKLRARPGPWGVVGRAGEGEKPHNLAGGWTRCPLGLELKVFLLFDHFYMEGIDVA